MIAIYSSRKTPGFIWEHISDQWKGGAKVRDAITRSEHDPPEQYLEDSLRGWVELKNEEDVLHDNP